MFNEPKAVFLSDFAETVQIGALEVLCIFDCEYQSAVGFGFDTANADPFLICRADTLPADAGTAHIRARGKDYRAASIEPDGTGFCVIQLRSIHETSNY